MTETSPISSHSSDRAWRSGAAQIFFWIVVALTAALDLGTKGWAFEHLVKDEVLSVIPGLLHLTPIRNQGAVFGIGAGKRWLFIAASIVAMIFIFQLFAHSGKKQRGFHFLLALTLGGAIGNLYDRATEGTVRDFIYLAVSLGGIRLWPWVFNIADVALVIGVFGLLLGWLLGKFEIGSSIPVARPVTPEAKE